MAGGGARVLAAAGLRPQLTLTHGTGATAARVLRGEGDLFRALDAVAAPAAPPEPPDPDALRTALAGLGAQPVITDLSEGSALSGLVAQEPYAALATSPARALLAVHLHGHTVDWRAGLGRAPRRRLELPVAALREDHCWPVVAPADGPAANTPAADDVPDTVPASVPGPAVAAQGAASSADGVAETVLAFARDVLKEPGLSLSDDFFQVGGNSLNGTQMISRINERFATNLEVLDLFDLPDLRALAEWVAEQSAAPATATPVITTPATPAPATAVPSATDSAPTPAPVRETGQQGPLSGPQTAIWAADRLDPESGTYNVPAALLLDADFDADLGAAELADRLTRLARRHPMLRAGLRDTPDGPRQVITPADEVRVELEHRELDLTAWTEADGRAELLDRLRALVAQPLSLYDRLPSRHQLVRVHFADRRRTVLLLTYHHLFVDGWSWRLLFRDLADDTGGEPPEPKRGYLDHVHEQRELLGQEAGRRLERFWSDYLDGAPYVPLPADREATGTRDRAVGTELLSPIDQELAESIRGLARRERCTPHMVMLAAWAALLWRIGGERDVTVAVPTAGRAPADETVVGNYANVIAVRVRVRPDEPFSALLAAVRETSLTTLAHQGLPTDRIRRIARPGSADPLAPTMFGFNSDVEPLHRLGEAGPAVELLDVGQGAAAFPLSVVVLEYGGEMRARFQYDPELFASATVRDWLEAYRLLLARLADQGPDARTSALSDPGADDGPADGNAVGRPGRGAGPYVPPDTEAEQLLAELWARHLGQDRVGRTDDFFDLGGDSVTAIAVASEAGRQGLMVRPRTILDLRTLHAVAARTVRSQDGGNASPTDSCASGAQETAGTPDEVTTDSCQVDLTPAQREFLERGAVRPDHWNHGVLYSARRPLDLPAVEQALGLLARRHPVLRARYHHTNGTWTQSADGVAPVVTAFDLRGTDAERVSAELDELATGLHESLDLRTGPVCRAGLFRLPAGLPDQLLLVVHHTVVDLYSWNILTEELSVLLRDGQETHLGPTGPSYLEWARRLADHVRSRPGQLDGSYWLDRTWGEGSQVPVVPDGARGVEGNTRELVTDCGALPATGAGITAYERLLAAAGSAFQEWLGAKGGEVAVRLVGHGREDLVPGLDLGRTVGYFNTAFPFALALPGRRDSAAHTAYVAGELRSVPRRGFDFEALRWFHPDAAVRRALAAVPVPQVLFSFWGTPAFLQAGWGADTDGVLTDVRTELVGRDRAFDMERPCPLEIYPSVVDGRVRVRWQYSGEVFSKQRIQDLANAFDAALADHPTA
ncbi:condensation domain-containing protein [Streptomyces sp. MST-110588]|uniref:condensation domain-containing protein n=1 Tax=Streptomyces sp. MST-110588 TaxID=2833628 RepID=UPI001F5C8834|nr:condensation domain-containing protein [Streptomyces sp. MST-110588]UNO40116.1 hypothetical protein KGS77_11585 [Streptomyces sp. MST-110588]